MTCKDATTDKFDDSLLSVSAIRKNREIGRNYSNDSVADDEIS